MNKTINIVARLFVLCAVSIASADINKEVSAQIVDQGVHPPAGLVEQAAPEVPPGIEEPQVAYPPAQATAPVVEAPRGPKKAGVIRIGVATPTAQIGQGSVGFDPSEAIRNTIVTYLSGPLVEVTPLTSRIEMQLKAEAKEKECDYILYSSLTQKRGGGGGLFGKLGPVGSIAVSAIPMGGAASAAGAVAGAAASTAISAATMAGSFKAKDEITFQYKVVTPDNTATLVANTTKAKAKNDGDDVLSPQIEQAATAVLNEVGKRKQQ